MPLHALPDDFPEWFPAEPPSGNAVNGAFKQLFRAILRERNGYAEPELRNELRVLQPKHLYARIDTLRQRRRDDIVTIFRLRLRLFKKLASLFPDTGKGGLTIDCNFVGTQAMYLFKRMPLPADREVMAAQFLWSMLQGMEKRREETSVREETGRDPLPWDEPKVSDFFGEDELEQLHMLYQEMIGTAPTLGNMP